MRRRGGRGLHKKTANSLPFPGVKGKTNSPGKKLRDYLEPAEVDALIKAAPNPTANVQRARAVEHLEKAETDPQRRERFELDKAIHVKISRSK